MKSHLDSLMKTAVLPRYTGPWHAPLLLALAVSCLWGTVVAHAATEPLHAPVETGHFRAPDLVELIAIDPHLKLDIHYARTDNFLHQKLYAEPRAYMQRPAAMALKKVDDDLRRQGYGLVIFDAYRPWSITKLMWDRSPEAWRSGGYVADPAQGSRHNRGCAVDLSMFDVRTGREVTMPTPYDDFTPAAHADAPVADPEARRHRAMLRHAMEAHGFMPLAEEWWHFDYQDWRHYRIIDVDPSHLGH
jgi:D-alanyl-D-alanine dipeptidase